MDCESTMCGFNSHCSPMNHSIMSITVDVRDQDNPKGLWDFFVPIRALPSPPTWGWSTGFITTSLTTGRLPSQRLNPTLPKLLYLTPIFPTCPAIAEQFLDVKRTSPKGNFNVVDFFSFVISCATTPAALANCPPSPSMISMLCMTMPKGILVKARVFPIFIGTLYQKKWYLQL
ncbi:hypothetical protein Cgig2_010246 [Carnegiea gigantea]|uniref:Uncharacterized protein ycf72 n=1 Tax=Carnegiea gigantea TaxID=171969 RepID=A0A9Q1JNU2_9CARY|nr:hypothetical protein Cgig2_010246 [Carnegiea gigantea]